MCGRCEAVRYCSRECQRTDWKAHRPVCAAAHMGTLVNALWVKRRCGQAKEAGASDQQPGGLPLACRICKPTWRSLPYPASSWSPQCPRCRPTSSTGSPALAQSSFVRSPVRGRWRLPVHALEVRELAHGPAGPARGTRLVPVMAMSVHTDTSRLLVSCQWCALRLASRGDGAGAAAAHAGSTAGKGPGASKNRGCQWASGHAAPAPGPGPSPVT